MPPEALRDGFSSLARWTPEFPGEPVLLTADPGFEIVWSPMSLPRLQPACRTSRLTAGANRDPLTLLRLRPEAVGAWFGSDALAWTDGPSVPLDALGPGWRRVSRAESEAELLQSLARISRAPFDPMVRRSITRLGTVRPPSFVDIAASEGYSYEQWLRRMKRSTGVSPRFLVGYRGLRRATRLARSRPAMSMAEVAFRTGFASDSALASAATRLGGRTFRTLVADFNLPE